MAERPKIDVEALINEKITFKLETAESLDERASRLPREEAEEDHKRRIELIVTVFAMTVLGIAFLVCVLIVAVGDPKSVVTDKAMTIIAAIAAAVGGYLTGKKSK